MQNQSEMAATTCPAASEGSDAAPEGCDASDDEQDSAVWTRRGKDGKKEVW
jgi:hypothetical protein